MEQRHAGVPPYTLTAEYRDEASAKRDQWRIQAVIHQAACDLPADRPFPGGVPYVIVLVKRPPAALRTRLTQALVAGGRRCGPVARREGQRIRV